MPQTPPPDRPEGAAIPPLDDFLCFALYAAGHAMTRFYKPLLDPLGLTYPQYLAMVALWEKGERTVGELGEALGLESSTLTPLLKRLEAMGHVVRARDSKDERVVRVRPTDQGMALRERAAAVPGCLFAASGLSLDELVSLRRQLVVLRRALETEPGAADG
ncbi:MarR family winged helix-turn-helix transcriptional regulator [Xanthobacter tagetidis]|uniref:MarR family transcriptional regulator n=1 Tax=Xanthobacter tagetidis TaxID=60216 RepID=A0A3L7AN64_9HYPH|nr:MarR family transcriptional regulator [Xanthobacter tagetidis]MBB6308294.1 DNA-binding MarR family transcriptional regulator [Xanthobacter tagetidis]RLP81899.1 MarR family transcriptional regulator [Xanthobacter tagetidis]